MSLRPTKSQFCELSSMHTVFRHEYHSDGIDVEMTLQLMSTNISLIIFSLLLRINNSIPRAYLIYCTHIFCDVRFRHTVYVRYIRNAYVLTVVTAYACGQYYIITAEPWMVGQLSDQSNVSNFKLVWIATFVRKGDQHLSKLLNRIKSFLLTINKIAFTQLNSL